MMRKYIFNIILIIVWMFIIFNFSNQNGNVSKETSNSLIVKIVSTISSKELSQEEQQKLTSTYSKIVRKTAHFTAYFILGVLSFRLYYKIYGLTPKALVYPFILCFIYACSDEIHQLFISGRSGEILDVLIDTCGATFSIAFLFIFHRKFKKNDFLQTKI